ncbi:MAG: hypothetical protein A2589_03130 [Candidatus Vogelbacteria bacterium RIFOXYD1_FULL_46_19]|uniref:Uncharacterized protein n=1 Tax=Candidatus Vogelbacteria bacterium RIFOXYD1_FULL_46_19 TaxID=1802439 RepID=A0A1G2QH60_9BACT|nr:MAG: hypothetical protein A2589_03130 [Candidatus Vogelbacteria bacterium RIFOXYD1_FULL_46_19]
MNNKLSQVQKASLATVLATVVATLLVLSASGWALSRPSSILVVFDSFHQLLAQVSSIGQCKLAKPQVQVIPGSQTVAPGGTVEYTLTLTNKNNNGCDPATFKIEPWLNPLFGLKASPASFTETLESGAKISRTFNLMVPDWSLEVPIIFNQRAYNIGRPVDWTSANARLTVKGKPLVTGCVYRPPLLTLTPFTQTSAAGDTVTYTYSLTNNNDLSCGETEFTLRPWVPADSNLTINSFAVSVAGGTTASGEFAVNSIAATTSNSYRFNMGAYFTATSTSGLLTYRGLQDAIYEVTPTIDEATTTATTTISSPLTNWGIECFDHKDYDGDGLAGFDDPDCFGPNLRQTDTDYGYTWFEPSPASRIIYVSNSSGDDSFDGLTPEPVLGTNQGPKKTILAGYNLLRPASADWLLLKRGDTFVEPDIWFITSGRLPTERILVASYGRSIQRPILINTRFSLFQTRNLAFAGLNFFSTETDLGVPQIGAMVPAKGGITIWERDTQSNNILIENNIFHFDQTNILNNTTLWKNIVLRLNVFRRPVNF